MFWLREHGALAGKSIAAAWAAGIGLAKVDRRAAGWFVGGSHEAPAADLTGCSVVRFACERRKTPVLADLTGAALEVLGLNNDVSASGDCAASQAWAPAIHGASPRWDGIQCVSRQMNKGFAYAIFERSGLCKLRAERLKARRVDDPCDRLRSV